MRIFRGMEENCRDNEMCREYLVLAAQRLTKFVRGKYGGGIDGAAMLQLMKFYRDMRSGDFSAAYSRLYIRIAAYDLTQSEMAANLVPVIFSFTEDMS